MKRILSVLLLLGSFFASAQNPAGGGHQNLTFIPGRIKLDSMLINISDSTLYKPIFMRLSDSVLVRGTFVGAGGGAGLTSINTATGPAITFATGTSGTNFTVNQSGNTITLNLPDASGTARGVVTTSAQTLGAGIKTFTTDIVIDGGGNPINAGVGSGNGTDNTFFGWLTGGAATGSNNDGFGAGALRFVGSGHDNVAIGTSTGQQHSFNNCVYIGSLSGTNASSDGNVGVGVGTLNAALTGGGNVAIGGTAMPVATSASLDVGIGQNALATVTTASSVIGIGSRALGQISTNGSAVAIGGEAGDSSTVGNSVYLGNAAGYKNTQDSAFYVSNSSAVGSLVNLLYGRFGTGQLILNPGNTNTPSVQPSWGLGSVQTARAQLSAIYDFTHYTNFTTGSTGILTINPTAGKVLFSGYGSGTNTGTAAFNLEVDASGNMIEGALTNSGTYSPSMAAVTNCSAISQTVSFYTQNGKIYHVRVRGSVTATAPGDCSFTISLPSGTNTNIVSNLGEGIVTDATYLPAVVGATSGTLMIVHYIATGTSADAYGVSFDYSN